MVDLIQKYNQKLARRIQEIKSSNSEILEELYKLEEKFTNNTYQVGLGAEPAVHRQFLLSVMSHFHMQNQELKELVNLKNQLNNNHVKMSLYREIIGTSSPSAHQKPGQNVSQREERASVHTATFGEISTDTIPGGLEAESESLQEELRAKNEETTRLAMDLKNIVTRTQMLEKELKKTRDLNKAKADENLGKKILDLEQQVRDIQEDLALMSG